MAQVLSGMRVLDLSEGIAGPVAAKMLGDFGAEVIKVEPPSGDSARNAGPFRNDVPNPEESALFLNFNRNKLGVTLDVFTTAGRAVLDRLIADADVLISSYSPALFEQLGLDYDALKAINPAIVVVAVTPWGLTGPYRDYRASEIVLDAFGHSMAAFGVRDREPLSFGGGLRGHYAGRFAGLAALAAVESARHSGTGQTVDVSMIEVQVGSADRRAVQLVRYAYNHRIFSRQLTGIGTGNIRGGFHPCADGWVNATLAPAHLPKLVEVLGHPEWLDAPEFQPIAEKWNDPDIQHELSAAFLNWSLTKTRAEISEIARANGFPIYAVNHFSDTLHDAHLEAREFWVEETHPVAGTNKYTGPPFRLQRGGYEQRMPAPLLGQHNREVYCDRYGMSAQELGELVAAGVVTSSEEAKTLGPSAKPVDAPAARLPRVTPSKPRLPLEGIRVLDMTAVWAGPSAAMIMSDLGAEVIRVESIQFFPAITRGGVIRPESNEQMEAFTNPFYNSYPEFDPGERPWNRFGGFNVMGRNKKSMTANLRTPEGVEIFKKLAAISDVVLDNYAFGVMERMGLGDEPLRAVNPRLINISMPLFGNSGPNRLIPGMGSVVDVWSGFLAMRGYRDFDLGAGQASTHMDSATGPNTAFAVLCAVREREQSGLGQFIDFSQSENMLQAAGEYFLDVQWNGKDRPALGNRDRFGGIQGCYPCTGTDNWVVLTVRTDDEWVALGEALGHPSWISDERFSSAALRYQHHNEIDKLISEWTSTQSPYDAMHKLQAVGIPAGRILNERDAFDDPHLQARGFFIKTVHPEAGTHLMPGHQWKMLGTPLRADLPSPLLGEHNEYVYKELLGYSDEDYARLEREEHIGRDYII